MSFSEILPVILSVLKDWRVIVTTILMLIVVALANRVVHYKKRPKPVKIDKKAAAAPAPEAPKKEDGKEEAEEE